WYASPEWRRRVLYQPSMNSKTAMRASAVVLSRRRSKSWHSSVAKKLSHMALSSASPTVPVEGRTPASRHRRPKDTDVYWANSSGRRNSSPEGSDDGDEEEKIGPGDAGKDALARPPAQLAR